MLEVEKLPNSYQQSIKNTQFNTSALTVWAEQNNYYLQPSYSKCLIPTVLKIDRKTQVISQIPSNEFNPPQNSTPYYFSFFIGIVDLGGKKIIMLAETVQVVCSFNSRDIFKITKPLFLFYRPNDKKNLNQEQARILINLVLIFEQGMYFSFTYNLSEPLHHIKKIEHSSKKSSFNWAKPLQTQLYHCDKMWSLPVIQGFVNKIELYINAQKLKIILISRRSIEGGGPWQYTTGLLENGDCANYVQTEQIFCINRYVFSFVQVRGTVPLFWTQKFSYGIQSSIQINKSFEENLENFKFHLSKLIKNRDYDYVVLINLLNKETGTQKKLIQNYEHIVKKCQKQMTIKQICNEKQENEKKVSLFYSYFDLHNKCQNKNYSTLNKFILDQLQPILLACGFTAVHMKQDKNFQILNLQKGIIRTNCGTCIDRTNIMQSRLAAFQLVFILNQINIKIQNFNKELNFISGDDAFALLYRNLWADNGDYISKQYTGTGSIESYAIRKGKLSYMTKIDHGLTSLTRALRNIRQEDEQKKKTVQYLIEKVRKSEKIKYEKSKN